MALGRQDCRPPAFIGLWDSSGQYEAEYWTHSDARSLVKEATEMQGSIKLLAHGTQLANTWKAADNRGHPLWQNSEVDAGWGYFFIFQPNFTRPGLTWCDPGSSASGIYYAFVDSLGGLCRRAWILIHVVLLCRCFKAFRHLRRVVLLVSLPSFGKGSTGDPHAPKILYSLTGIRTLLICKQSLH